MEISHRGAAFLQLAHDSQNLLRDLLAIPENYHVLFLAGGATSQFSMVPMNLLREKTKAAYIHSGVFSKRAFLEAEKYCQPLIVAETGQENGFSTLPDCSTLTIDQDCAYLYYAENETVQGIQFHSVPHCEPELPLVCDMTSSILSHVIDIEKFGVVFCRSAKEFRSSWY